ncbi:MAG: aminodeoxychorismate/anthranilate synthase component II, partial [Betaproteobacteria bacterium]|nr:aminodeoxychorismate/anthranilate synthase component II [Betaproteobacteria bacterium]
VHRNDEITIEDIKKKNPQYIVLSPGPCTPNEAGISMPAIRHFCGKIPILGVCLGHQSIGQVFGGRIIRARQVMHGKSSLIAHQGQGVFAGLPDRFSVVRYHSLAIERASLPECLSITAQTEDGEIMGVRHREFPIEGLQFHPESIDTEHGMEMLERFLKSN